MLWFDTLPPLNKLGDAVNFEKCDGLQIEPPGVHTLAGVNVLYCSWTRHLTLSVPLSLSTHNNKGWRLKCWGYLWWTSFPSWRSSNILSKLFHATESSAIVWACSLTGTEASIRPSSLMSTSQHLSACMF